MLPKLYTRRGDDGRSDLMGQPRASKAGLRFTAIGEVDELNASIGLALTACEPDELTAILTHLQHRLFELGADLAAPPEVGGAARITPTDITHIEHAIDTICEPLPEMREFVLPGGTELAARLHLARTVCRRAERACVALSEKQAVSNDLLVFLNRISDLLFAMARRANQLADQSDVPWRKTSGSESV